ncbi:MAG: hypothetical protein M1834_000891 [Cirrosporium novae-zelandiae]|nr:MAG: hypothetical protein M1834_000891 [Cirrosporium novae-zelandiae]
MASSARRMSASLMKSLTVPKNRRPKFELTLRIQDLNNIPLVRGCAYVKWNILSSPSAEHRGRTEKSPVRDHKAVFDYTKIIPVRLTIDRNSLLQSQELHFEVIQEYSAGTRGDRIILGNVKLNLAEYVESSTLLSGGEDQLRASITSPTRGSIARDEILLNADEGITRRYLLQDSRVNSTLKISINLHQIDGDRSFIAPPLKSAPVFGGIAGIMTAEQREGSPDDVGHLPSMSSKMREQGELQDMYRRTLAASWAAMKGELPADKCVESIFAGGDGWAREKDGAKPHGKKVSMGSKGSIGGIDEDLQAAVEEKDDEEDDDGLVFNEGTQESPVAAPSRAPSTASRKTRSSPPTPPSVSSSRLQPQGQSTPFLTAPSYTKHSGLDLRYPTPLPRPNLSPKSASTASATAVASRSALQIQTLQGGSHQGQKLQNSAGSIASSIGSNGEKRRYARRKRNEISEFEVIGDLSSWAIGERAY